MKAKRPERSYMDIVKHIQQPHEVSTPTGPVGPKRPVATGTPFIYTHINPNGRFEVDLDRHIDFERGAA